ncbi:MULTISPECIES: hypothetical protein [Streptomyces]|uniref:Uncharacterized protein n=1 Tax=Streptomyces eurythermus TaxID=42237 RepID=A0ABW6YZD7_9ACTN|nr:hypothetical protein [Streptomyces sp. DSM 40868]QIS75481.1 hypothetical protein HB370_40675 [Streptomyces sp. DSM 40868]
MRIEIMNLAPEAEAEKGPMIAFRGTSGQAWARWCGADIPQVGALVDVEFDVPDEVSQWTIADGPAIMTSDFPGSPVRIKGVVASVADNSVVALQVDTDIVLVEFAGTMNSVQSHQTAKPRLGDCIEFTTHRLDLYPYSV